MNMPNTLTIVRMVLIPVFAGLYAAGHPVAALCVYVAACITDAVDGYLARRWNQVTAFGKLMDPLADKLLQLTMMGCLTLTGYIHWWVLAVMAAKEIFMVIGGTMLLKRRNVVVFANWAGKVATVMIILSVLAIYPWHPWRWLRMAGKVMLDVAVGFSLFALVNYIMIYVKNANAPKNRCDH